MAPPKKPPKNGYIVELQPGCWLAPWSGDPGRTLVRASAKTFDSESAARRAIRRHRSVYFRPLTTFRILPCSEPADGQA